MDLADVLEINILHDKESINQHLKYGWKLLSIATGCEGDYHDPSYMVTEATVGRVKDSREVPQPEPKQPRYQNVGRTV